MQSMWQIKLIACGWHVLCIRSYRQDAHLAVAKQNNADVSQAGCQMNLCSHMRLISYQDHVFSQLCSLSRRIPLAFDRRSDWH